MPEPIRVLAPATGALLREVADEPAAAVSAAVDRARRAQPRWGAAPFADRKYLLRALARRIRDDTALADLLVAESGKSRFEAEAMEVFYTCELTRFATSRTARKALADDVRRPFLFAHKRARVVRHPRGVVGVIGPWNWPLLNNYADCVFPLAAGNAVVLKPSERTPLTSLRVAELARAAGLPDGVFQVVTGRGAAGQALLDAVDMVFFTGSPATGAAVARRAAERVIPAVLELGGKSAMIVLADADLDRAARAAVWSAFAHAGQVCIRSERVYVEAAVAGAFEERCVDETRKLRLGGSGLFDVGAITFARQIDVCARQTADAVAKGALVRAGGAPPAGRAGQWFEPTVLTGCTAAMAVMNEETFGPLLPIQRVRDADEAVALANASPFGLSGSVWSRDTARARAIARRLETGNVCLNDVLVHYFCVEAPTGGVKASGLGVRHGPEGLQQFCRLETIVEDAPLLGWLSPLVSRALGFPYRDGVLRAIRRAMRMLY